MKTKLRILCAALLLPLLMACVTEQQAVVPTQPTDDPDEPVTIEVVGTNGTPTEAPSVEASSDIPDDEPEATAEPQPTREPKAGDIAANFPNYDTGTDADYSYQSDELRIAIKVVVDAEQKQTYYVADIWARNLNAFRTQFSQSEFNKPTEEGDSLARRENAIFAVNGNYNQGLTVHAGTKYKNLRDNKGWNSCAVCVIYRDGTMKTFRLGTDKFDINAELENGAWHAWQFGPVIIRDYEIDPQATRYSLGYKARNMLGYYEPGHYVIVTCDAQRDDAQGMTEDQMATVMKSLGVKEAFNLDGGTSAVMVFMGKVINRPTMRNDNGTMVAGRPLKDMLLFGEYDENGVSADLSTFTADKFLGE